MESPDELLASHLMRGRPSVNSSLQEAVNEKAHQNALRSLSGPRRLCSGWHSVKAVNPCLAAPAQATVLSKHDNTARQPNSQSSMITDCSVFAISSNTSSKPELLDSPSFLHSWCLDC